MSILNYEEMTLESDTFQAARETFNLMLQKLFKKMEQSDMDEGSIDLKISIELNEDYVPQDDGTTVRIKKPLIKHKECGCCTRSFSRVAGEIPATLLKLNISNMKSHI